MRPPAGCRWGSLSWVALCFHLILTLLSYTGHIFLPVVPEKRSALDDLETNHKTGLKSKTNVSFNLYRYIILPLHRYPQCPTHADGGRGRITALKNNYDILLLKNDSAVFALQKKYANSALYPRINAAGTMLSIITMSNRNYRDGSIRKGSGIRSSNLASNINP